MPITIRPITHPLPLDAYDADLEITSAEGVVKTVHVWVNPPRAVLEAHTALRERARAAYASLEAAGNDPEQLKAVGAELVAVGGLMADWYARLWSQHPDPATHWTADEVRELGASETDPGLYAWLTNQAVGLVNAHRERAKKN
jgi:hypothetical protein